MLTNMYIWKFQYECSFTLLALYNIVISFFNANSFRSPQFVAVLNRIDTRKIFGEKSKLIWSGVCWHQSWKKLDNIYNMS